MSRCSGGGCKGSEGGAASAAVAAAILTEINGHNGSDSWIHGGHAVLSSDLTVAVVSCAATHQSLSSRASEISNPPQQNTSPVEVRAHTEYPSQAMWATSMPPRAAR